jgi:hypothetical protein
MHILMLLMSLGSVFVGCTVLAYYGICKYNTTDSLAARGRQEQRNAHT